MTTLDLINVDKIVPNKNQPRTTFDQKALEELAVSIETVGLIQAIVVRPLSEQEKKEYNAEWEIISGERRWRATKLLGQTTIRAEIQEDTSIEKQALQALIENIQREQLNPIEEANAFQRLLDLQECDQLTLAKQLGKSRSYLNNSLRLLKLDTNVQELIVAGKLGVWQAIPIVPLPRKLQEKVAYQIIDHGMNVEKAREFCNAQIQKLKGAEVPTTRKVSLSKTTEQPKDTTGENSTEDPFNLLEENTNPVVETVAESSEPQSESSVNKDHVLKDSVIVLVVPNETIRNEIISVLKGYGNNEVAVYSNTETKTIRDKILSSILES